MFTQRLYNQCTTVWHNKAVVNVHRDFTTNVVVNVHRDFTTNVVVNVHRDFTTNVVVNVHQDFTTNVPQYDTYTVNVHWVFTTNVPHNLGLFEKVLDKIYRQKWFALRTSALHFSICIPLEIREYQHNLFLISPWKYMLWVLIWSA